jgi:DNA polymerase-1
VNLDKTRSRLGPAPENPKTPMPDSLFLIDGYSLLYQSFYGLPGLSSPDGTPTGAIYGFLRVLDKILRDRDPTYLAVVFDAQGPTFRHEAYPEYKQNRKPMPDELKVQIPILLDIVRARRVPVFEEKGVEADDVLGTLAKRFAKKGVDVYLISRDKDLKQLLDDHICLYDPKTDKVTGVEAFQGEMGIPPSLFPDLLGLAGDTSDNLPGVPGVGEKTALTLLKEFGDLESVLSGWEKIKGAKRQANIRDFADQARLSKKLAIIKTDVPVEAPLKAMKPGPEDGEAIVRLYSALGFESLLEAEKEASEERDYRRVTPKTFKRFLKTLTGAREFAFDLETTGPDPVGSELVGFSFSFKPNHAWYLPVRAPEGATLFDEGDLLSDLGPILSDPAKGKIGHNLKFDATVLLRRGIALRGIVFDTLVAAYLLNPGRRSLKLDALAEEILRVKTIPITDLIGQGKAQTTLDCVDLDCVTEYACEDADIALRLRNALAPRLEGEALHEVFQRAEMPIVEILAAMETARIGLDPSRFQGLKKEVEDRMDALEERIHRGAGETFNLNSPKQLQEVLYEKMGLPKLKKTEKKTGASTNAAVLKDLARLCRKDDRLPEAKLLANLLEYRVLKKLQSTYIHALPKGIHPDTGRLHASFNQAVVATGRLSSSNPNLQNIPARTELGRRIREAFVPAKGCRFFTADYSQVELRIMAHLSGDEALAEAFRKGEDIHEAVAAEIHGVEPGEVTKAMRQVAKAVNFGILYGQSAFGLAKELEIPQGEAQAFIERYFERFAGVKTFIDDLVVDAHEKGRVRTMLGRLRLLPEIKSSNRNRRMFAERTAVNTVIQGSAADLIKLAMIEVDRRIREAGWPAKMLVQIHDELLFEVEADAVPEVQEGVVAGMEGAMSLNVPLKVDTAVGDNWMAL